MAYVPVTTVTQVGPTEYVVVVDETGAGPADEALIEGPPITGKVRRSKCDLISGTGTTVQPILGSAPNPTALEDIIIEEGLIASQTDSAGSAPYYDLTPAAGNTGGQMYHRSRVDAGADNVIRTEYHISTRW